MNLVFRYNVPREIIINDVAFYNNSFENAVVFRVRFNGDSAYQFRISNEELYNQRYDILQEMIYNIKRALERHQLEHHHRRDYVNADRLIFMVKDSISRSFSIPEPTPQPVAFSVNADGDVTFSQRFSYGAPPISLGRAIANISF